MDRQRSGSPLRTRTPPAEGIHSVAPRFPAHALDGNSSGGSGGSSMYSGLLDASYGSADTASVAGGWIPKSPPRSRSGSPARGRAGEVGEALVQPPMRFGSGSPAGGKSPVKGPSPAASVRPSPARAMATNAAPAAAAQPTGTKRSNAESGAAAQQQGKKVKKVRQDEEGEDWF